MKAKIKLKVWNWIAFAVMIVVIVAMIVADCLCKVNAGAITNLLCGMGLRFDGKDVEIAMAESDALVQKLGDEGFVLLKNTGGADGKGILPLAENERKINLFGWSSSAEGFVYKGEGSGAGTVIESKRVTLADALKNVGVDDNGHRTQDFEVNEMLLQKYAAYQARRTDKFDDSEPVTLVEPTGSAFYTDEIMNYAKEFSDTAIITFSRWAAEGMEIPYHQHKKEGRDDYSRTYLQLSTEEEWLIDLVTDNFDKVIVLINSCNSMEMGFLDNDKIDAAILVGVPGQSGTTAVRRILTGEVNPSGRTVDTYPYSHKSNPSYANKHRSGDHIHYVEGIYNGYKWYETAFADKLVHTAYDMTFDYSTEQSYRSVVQYPFGYGLSYTEFEWNVVSAKAVVGETETDLKDARITNKKAKIEVNVEVTNIGDVPGMEVVQLYATPPYFNEQIEKSAVNLMAFAKTSLLEPEQTENLTLEFDLYDMASYDCYDKNGNGASAYELDAGDYSVKLMNNAHELNACDDAEISFNIPTTLKYKLDPDTKQIVKNRFTGETAYGGVPIDGSTAGIPIEYLSRSNFTGTFPTTAAINRSGSEVSKANGFVYTGYDNSEKYTATPTQGVDYGNERLALYTREDGSPANTDDLRGTSGVELKLNEELVEKLGRNYKAPEYEQLLNQLTVDELFTLVEDSGYRNYEMVSIGKALLVDSDGPGGYRVSEGTPSWANTATWTGFCGQMNIAQTFSTALAFAMGRTMANEGITTGTNGWYAPGVNLHRTPYNGRYFEYYSEDPVLSGVMGAYVIKGAGSANVYCYLKHFVLSEMGINPKELNVWLTEQALREIYLKPFEICVKDGDANAVMSAFNRIGGTWTGGCKALLRDVLRTEWGFRGVVLTDWSTGGSYMNPYQGIRAGNDMWLNPNKGNIVDGVSHKDNVNINLARDAAHNMIYTVCNTYCKYKDYDPADGEFVASVGIRQKDKVFPWWIPVLVALNVVVFGIIIFETTWIFIKGNKRYKLAQAAEANGTTLAAIEAENKKQKKSRKNKSVSETRAAQGTDSADDIVDDVPTEEQNEFEQPTSAVVRERVFDVDSVTGEIDKLRAENAELKSQLEEFKSELVALTTFADELKTLREKQAETKRKRKEAAKLKPKTHKAPSAKQQIDELKKELDEIKKLLDKA